MIFLIHGAESHKADPGVGTLDKLIEKVSLWTEIITPITHCQPLFTASHAN